MHNREARARFVPEKGGERGRYTEEQTEGEDSVLDIPFFSRDVK